MPNVPRIRTRQGITDIAPDVPTGGVSAGGSGTGGGIRNLSRSIGRLALGLQAKEQQKQRRIRQQEQQELDERRKELEEQAELARDNANRNRVLRSSAALRGDVSQLFEEAGDAKPEDKLAAAETLNERVFEIHGNIQSQLTPQQQKMFLSQNNGFMLQTIEDVEKFSAETIEGAKRDTTEKVNRGALKRIRQNPGSVDVIHNEIALMSEMALTNAEGLSESDKTELIEEISSQAFSHSIESLLARGRAERASEILEDNRANFRLDDFRSLQSDVRTAVKRQKRTETIEPLKAKAYRQEPGVQQQVRSLVDQGKITAEDARSIESFLEQGRRDLDVMPKLTELYKDGRLNQVDQVIAEDGTLVPVSPEMKQDASDLAIAHTGAELQDRLIDENPQFRALMQSDDPEKVRRANAFLAERLMMADLQMRRMNDMEPTRIVASLESASNITIEELETEQESEVSASAVNNAVQAAELYFRIRGENKQEFLSKFMSNRDFQFYEDMRVAINSGIASNTKNAIRTALTARQRRTELPPDGLQISSEDFQHGLGEIQDAVQDLSIWPTGNTPALNEPEIEAKLFRMANLYRLVTGADSITATEMAVDRLSGQFIMVKRVLVDKSETSLPTEVLNAGGPAEQKEAMERIIDRVGSEYIKRFPNEGVTKENFLLKPSGADPNVWVPHIVTEGGVAVETLSAGTFTEADGLPITQMDAQDLNDWANKLRSEKVAETGGPPSPGNFGVETAGRSAGETIAGAARSLDQAATKVLSGATGVSEERIREADFDRESFAFGLSEIRLGLTASDETFDRIVKQRGGEEKSGILLRSGKLIERTGSDIAGLPSTIARDLKAVGQTIGGAAADAFGFAKSFTRGFLQGLDE